MISECNYIHTIKIILKIIFYNKVLFKMDHKQQGKWNFLNTSAHPNSACQYLDVVFPYFSLQVWAVSSVHTTPLQYQPAYAMKMSSQPDYKLPSQDASVFSPTTSEPGCISPNQHQFPKAPCQQERSPNMC